MPREEIPKIENVINYKNAGDAPFLDANYCNKLRSEINKSVYLGNDNEDGDDIGNNIVSFNETISEEPLRSGEKQKNLFSKIQRFFSKIKALAFKDKINTLSINDKQITTSKIKNKAVTDAKISNVDGSKINNNSINSEKIKEIKSDKIKVDIPKATIVENYDTTTGKIKEKFEEIEERIKSYQVQEEKLKTINGEELNINVNSVIRQGNLCVLKFEILNAEKGAFLPDNKSDVSINWRYKLPFSTPFCADDKIKIYGDVYAGETQISWKFGIRVSDGEVIIGYAGSYQYSVSLKTIKFYLGITL